MAIVDGAPRLLYFGMFGALSRLPLAALLSAGLNVRAVVVPANEPDAAPIARHDPPAGWSARPDSAAALLRRTVVDLAWERDLPVFAVTGLRDAGLLALLGSFAPDLIAVSCFPYRFPPALLALPRLGILNLHPALLPRGRGPAPLFWTLREGLDQGGVTVHLLDTGLDSGPIVAQQSFALADGMTGAELELRAAALGADLLVGAVGDLISGAVTPRPQEEARATVDPWPGAADFVVPVDRPARWAFNFIRGTTGWGWSHQLALGGKRLRVRAARAYDPEARLGQPWVRVGDALQVQCSPGVLTVATAARTVTGAYAGDGEPLAGARTNGAATAPGGVDQGGGHDDVGCRTNSPANQDCLHDRPSQQFARATGGADQGGDGRGPAQLLARHP